MADSPDVEAAIKLLIDNGYGVFNVKVFPVIMTRQHHDELDRQARDTEQLRKLLGVIVGEGVSARHLGLHLDENEGNREFTIAERRAVCRILGQVYNVAFHAHGLGIEGTDAVIKAGGE